MYRILPVIFCCIFTLQSAVLAQLRAQEAPPTEEIVPTMELVRLPGAKLRYRNMDKEIEVAKVRLGLEVTIPSKDVAVAPVKVRFSIPSNSPLYVADREGDVNRVGLLLQEIPLCLSVVGYKERAHSEVWTGGCLQRVHYYWRDVGLFYEVAVPGSVVCTQRLGHKVPDAERELWNQWFRMQMSNTGPRVVLKRLYSDGCCMDPITEVVERRTHRMSARCWDDCEPHNCRCESVQRVQGNSCRCNH